jgi:hypothetical protein
MSTQFIALLESMTMKNPVIEELVNEIHLEKKEERSIKNWRDTTWKQWRDHSDGSMW